LRKDDHGVVSKRRHFDGRHWSGGPHFCEALDHDLQIAGNASSLSIRVRSSTVMLTRCG